MRGGFLIDRLDGWLTLLRRYQHCFDPTCLCRTFEFQHGALPKIHAIWRQGRIIVLALLVEVLRTGYGSRQALTTDELSFCPGQTGDFTILSSVAQLVNCVQRYAGYPE
jgi:hypothetical protein